MVFFISNWILKNKSRFLFASNRGLRDLTKVTRFSTYDGETASCYGWFHGTCDTIYTTFTKSFETFRPCAIIISKTFLPLDKSYTTFCWRAVAQIPSTLRNDFFRYVLPCNPHSFALLYAIEILMIDSDSSLSGLSESISFKFFWVHLSLVGLWKPFLYPGIPGSKTPLTENSEHSEVSHLIEQQKIYRSICVPSGGSEVSLR
jgi:hypothetical protein